MNNENITSVKIINCLYSHFKDSPKKLRIICGWDEVIQSHEPYALHEVQRSIFNEKNDNFFELKGIFGNFFKQFWGAKPHCIRHSVYGSRMEINDKELAKRYEEIKNSPNFYQEAPFLSIAKELLMLIKADKVERLIFLSAYDKRKFPNVDLRKQVIFDKTFGRVFLNKDKKPFTAELMVFDSEEKEKNKADWIKEHASDFDLVIDDNPLICGDILVRDDLAGRERTKVIAPYYPAIEQHHPGVLLLKTSVSDLKKEDFKDHEE